MMRITRETDYGIVLMAFMARNDRGPYSAADLARQGKLPLPMVSKILKALTKAGLLVSQRGAQGGYSLARAPQDISAAAIISALEGPIAITECSSAAPNACLHEGHCTVSSHWNRINRAVREALEGISLLEMSYPPAPQVGLVNLRGLLRPIEPTNRL